MQRSKKNHGMTQSELSISEMFNEKKKKEIIMKDIRNDEFTKPSKNYYLPFALQPLIFLQLIFSDTTKYRRLKFLSIFLSLWSIIKSETFMAIID